MDEVISDKTALEIMKSDEFRQAISYHRVGLEELFRICKDNKKFLTLFYFCFDMLVKKCKTKRSCTDKCSYCCYQKIELSEIELEVIQDYIKENNVQYDTDLLKQQQIEMKKYKDKACVFLSGGKCSIYTVRPIVCRNYFVTSDPELCNIETVTREVTVLQISNVMAYVFAHHQIVKSSDLVLSEALYKLETKTDERGSIE